MGKFIESQVSKLVSLVVVFGFFVLAMQESDASLRRKHGVKLGALSHFCPKMGICLPGLVPDSALASDLWVSSPKNARSKISVRAMAKRLVDQVKRFATTSAAAID